MSALLEELKKTIGRQPQDHPAVAFIRLGDDQARKLLSVLAANIQITPSSELRVMLLKWLGFETDDTTWNFLTQFVDNSMKATSLYASSLTCAKPILRFKNEADNLPMCTMVDLDGRHIQSDRSDTMRNQVMRDVDGKNGDVVIFIFGESGAGKTVLACQLASVSLLRNEASMVSCLLDGSELFKGIKSQLTVENYKSPDEKDALTTSITRVILVAVKRAAGVGEKLLRKNEEQKTEVAIVLDEMGADWLNIALRIVANREVSTELQKELKVDCVRFIVAGTGCDTLDASHLVSSWQRVHIVSPTSPKIRIPKWIDKSNSSAATQAKALMSNWRAGELLRQALKAFPQPNQDQGLSLELLRSCCVSACIQFKERNGLKPLTEEKLLSGFRHALSIVMSNQMTDLDSAARIMASQYGMLTDDLPRFIRVYFSDENDQESLETKKKALAKMKSDRLRRYHISQAQLVFYQLMVMGESIQDPSGAGFEKTVGDYLTLLGLAASFPGMRITPSLQLEKDTSFISPSAGAGTTTTTTAGGAGTTTTTTAGGAGTATTAGGGVGWSGVGFSKSRHKIEPRTDADSQKREFLKMLVDVKAAVAAGYTVVILNGDQATYGDLLVFAPGGRWWIIQAKRYEETTKLTATEFQNEVKKMTAKLSQKREKLPPKELNTDLFRAIYGEDCCFNDPHVVFFLGGPSKNFKEARSAAAGKGDIDIIHHSLKAPRTDNGFLLITGDTMYPIIPAAVPREWGLVVRRTPANGIDDDQSTQISDDDQSTQISDDDQSTQTKRSKRGRGSEE